MKAMAKRAMNTLSIIDVYCGVGGFSLGATRAGFKLVGAIDNDPKAIATHRENFPNTKHLQLDLTKVSGKKLLTLLGLKRSEVTGIVGGPPCQGFSTIGRNHTNDHRNDLFSNFFQLVKEIKPLFFVCENVPGILREKFNKVRKIAKDRLERDYIVLPPITLNASDYGAPTSRVRVFFIGFRKLSNIVLSENIFKPRKSTKKISVEYALKGLPIKIDPEKQSKVDGWRTIRIKQNGRYGMRLREVIPENIGDPTAISRLHNGNWVSSCVGTKHTKEVLKRWKRLEPGKIDKVSRTIRLDPKGFCPTLRAGTGRDKGSYQSLRPIHPTEDRVITPREAARLQGFPDWFVFHYTKWHSFRQIGNSVSPILAEVILSRIRKSIQ